jgi:hypothetical protein
MSRKIDFGGREWAAHAQDHWLQFAGNPRFQDYLRIAFVAFGLHRANGHARLAPHELAYFLVRADGTLPDRRSIKHSIDRAVEFGFLLPGSKALCLVVSSHHVQGGVGDPDKRCDRDHTLRQKDAAPRRPSGQKDVVGTGHFPEKDAVGRRPFVLVPSLSSNPPASARSSVRGAVS